MHMRLLGRPRALLGATVFLFACLFLYYLSDGHGGFITQSPTQHDVSDYDEYAERLPCIGPRGKLLTESPDDLVQPVHLDIRELSS